jgi:archaellum biogenesis ATPase FlaH
MKKLLAGLALLALVYAGPSFAQSASGCDETTMAKITTDMDAMTDPAMKANKDMATKYMGAARAAMDAKDSIACTTQITMAQKSMTMKCDEASMTAMKTEMDAMTDPAMKANKDEAMKSMEMAATAMTDKKMDECIGFMGQAMDTLSRSMNR